MDMEALLNALWGCLGGFMLGIGVLAANTLHRLRQDHTNFRLWRYLAAHGAVAVLLAMIGGVVTFIFDGRSGAFIQGAAALGLLLTLASYEVSKPGHRSEQS